MSAIDDLISQISDKTLRERIAFEIDKLAKQKKFGLVFEEHLPECTPLWDIPVKKGAKVALKAGQVSDFYTVLKIEKGIATCLNKEKTDTEEFPIEDLVTIAEFGEAIYPCLKPIDSVCNAPDSDLWHTLIEADNYHALQLLEYLYAGKVDCIYIDPPYNTGARDWKYNNDYVDSADQYRHSKWLSMMQKRLKIAKKLLNPKDSVLIVTIDEKEYLHLGCLLEELFPGARIQKVTDVINPKGVAAGAFARVEEYIYYIFIGDASPCKWTDNMLLVENDSNSRSNVVTWASLLRRGSNSKRTDRPKMYYPILVDEINNKVIRGGDILPLSEHPSYDEVIDGYKVAWPVRTDLSEGHWSLNANSLNKLIENGFVSLGTYDEKRKTWAIKYLFEKQREQIENGEIIITGYNTQENHVEVAYSGKEIPQQVRTVWHRQSHDAGTYGSSFIANILGAKKFTFPKSLYAEHDTIGMVVKNNQNALIVDFFAGSGTTLHAVNLLNAEDGGHRRCILVTNNEVSDTEAKEMSKNGLKPGDDEWEKLGIARYVTWPRTVCSIEGHDINGNPLKGNYFGSDIPMEDGFKANAAYFKLSFLDKNSVALGRQFKEMLPTLWMKAGAIGRCPNIETKTPDMLILPDNKFAVLVDERYYMDFVEKLEQNPEIETVFIVTDSESGYRDMISGLKVKDSYQLYRDYLDNFRINTIRR